ncbi:hypothetical protein [Nonomuraea jiangxiensis]|uniref:Uncharacterized protein n=1 Tax=Nonomuraea jiangxiensis TaxID=633440 RepID=A0A1G7Z9R2_9ACTN|nr:hypothetical protein [Nonomuraea jiangxiensis]SDH05502.1 hypothetical protein SAMN05421869_101355 [Nonomuraea jiangxiensis]
MLRRHRLGVPAFLTTGVYLAALAVSGVVALAAGDLRALRWVTLFVAPDEGIQATWPNVLVLTLAGLVVAWGVWQSLRGPLAGPPVEQDRDTWRLRVALYVAAAATLANLILGYWTLWAAVAVTTLPMVWVVHLLSPVVGRTRNRVLVLRCLGFVGYGGTAVALVPVLSGGEFDTLVLLPSLASLIWNVLVLRAQWDDDRWRQATVRYGILALVLPIVLTLVGSLRAVLSGVPWEAYDNAVVVVGVLVVVWLACSAHDLATPRAAPAPSAPAH